MCMMGTKSSGETDRPEQRVVRKLTIEHHFLYPDTYLSSEHQLQVHFLCRHTRTLISPDTLCLAVSLNRENSKSASKTCLDCKKHMGEIKNFE